MSNHGNGAEAEGTTDYERYLRVGSLLRLQKAPEDLAHPDEHLFQIMHQTAELWFKEILFEIDRAEAAMQRGEAVAAARLVNRCVEIVKVLSGQFDVLATMVPWDYHVIRLALGRGSGQESPGFNQVLASAPKLQDHFLALCARRGVTLDDVVTRRASGTDDLHLLEEELMAFAEQWLLWRERHLAFVKRMIGQGQKSLKGYSVEALEKHIRGHALFPELWAVRDTMTLEAGTSPPGKEPVRVTRS